MPWGDNSTVSYNGNYGSGTDSSQVGYFSRVDDATHYQLNIGTSDKHTSVDGYYSHDGSLAQVDLSANYHKGNTPLRACRYRAAQRLLPTAAHFTVPRIWAGHAC